MEQIKDPWYTCAPSLRLSLCSLYIKFLASIALGSGLIGSVDIWFDNIRHSFIALMQ